ncbi:MAG: tol-pal system protein YbgF [Deltaproteobacteria bacterium]|jgi:tol-pal system protein YbgF|nr:tol-pal system protein YbgF [Deltaproteobacteria bacterium]
MSPPPSRAIPSPAAGRQRARGIRARVLSAAGALALPAALAALALSTAACLPRGDQVVRRPEFEELKGRVANVEDIVIGRRAQGLPAGTPGGVPPGAGGYSPPLPAAPPSAAASSGSERSRYNRALALVRGRRYAEAEQSFRSFLNDYPNGRLSPNARYWLGESHYARGDFAGALAEFLRGYRDYPESAKAPDCLLKAAYSQSKLGDGPGAMESLRVLLDRYPGSSSAGLVRSGRSRFPGGS